jgi:diacylglycerol kinase
MEKLTKTSLRWVNVPKMLGSFVFAWRGLCQVVRHENNARVHLLATVGVGVAGVALGLSVGEWLAVLGLAVLVWVAELVNSAVERLVDLVSPQPHPLAGQAKDIAAGAVLVAAIGAAIGGLIIFGPKVGGLLGLA